MRKVIQKDNNLLLEKTLLLEKQLDIVTDKNKQLESTNKLLEKRLVKLESIVKKLLSTNKTLFSKQSILREQIGFLDSKLNSLRKPY